MKFIKILSLATLFLFHQHSAECQKKQRPNVIIILSDDQGYGDFSITGNPILETPALDALARGGVQFTDFHVSPLCTPTRGELLSGMDAMHNKAATVGTGRNTMRRDISTLPAVFQKNGYKTGIFGKWHLGDNYPDRPMDRGFDKAIWFHGWGLFSEYEFDNDYYKTRYLDGTETIQSDKYCTDLWFSEAISWMDQMAERKQPFFTYLSTNAPHGPFLAPKEDADYYKGKVNASEAQFFGMIRNIDRNMAELDKWLEKKNLKDNTIVIYMNDNGGTGGVSVYNAGMKGKKGDYYDGGHRAACFFRWPAGNIGTNRLVPTTSHIQDLFPTLLDLLSLDNAGASAQFDGVSLAPVLRDRADIHDRMFVVQYGSLNRPTKYSSCVIWNNWRLVGNDELYDIIKDPGQEHNVRHLNLSVFNKMLAFYDQWWNKRLQDLQNFVPMTIGSVHQPQVVLTSDFWKNDDYVNTQWKVANGQGPATGGIWAVDVVRDGIYEVELSRWPFHLDVALSDLGPATAVGGYKLRRGVALPIRYGCLSVNNGTVIIKEQMNPSVSRISFETTLTKSDKTLQAWFKDGELNDVCGAYYLRLRFVRKK